MKSNDLDVMPVDEYVNASYLNYSMYVILDRAMPHVGDGLKPVHRRIIYAMSELGLNHTAKYKKSARTVGDVLGKYHPHGDSACYEAMVLMSQKFSTRTPLVDGQGNWGSQDEPKSFAAMRYTEAKLTNYSNVLLNELKQDTVDWRGNFDGTLKEPIVLPAQVPNVLINGSTGIAVGMSTNIPPHNPTEVIDAAISFIKGESTTVLDLLEYIKGPDYPTGGEVINKREEIISAYETGRGKFTSRAEYTVKDNLITITSIPYQLPLSKVLVQIAEQVEDKKYNNIVDIKDVGDENRPVQVELTLRSSRVNPDEVMDHLYAHTDLEKVQPVSLTMIGLDGNPKTKSLIEVITEWCSFRQEVFERKKRYRLRYLQDRLHILEGFIIAFSNLDRIIEIIRTVEDPKSVLMSELCLSERQANAILELKLKQLAKLEENQLKEDFNRLEEERKEIEKLLASDKLIKLLLISELEDVKVKHASERLTKLIERDTSSTKKALIEQIPTGPVTILISKNGWIRSGKGHEIDEHKLNYKSGDVPKHSLLSKNDTSTIILGDTGKAYSLPNHELASVKSSGDPLSTKIKMLPEESVSSLISYAESERYLMSTDIGLGFIVKSEDLYSRNKKGKNVVNVASANLNKPLLIPEGSSHVVFATLKNRLLVVSLDELNTLPKGKGTKLISLKSEDYKQGDDVIVDVSIIAPDSTFEVFSGAKKFVLSPDDWSSYITPRARVGKLFEGKTKTGKLSIKLR
jgi:topoisomerase-4 subunit A